MNEILDELGHERLAESGEGRRVAEQRRQELERLQFPIVDDARAERELGERLDEEAGVRPRVGQRPSENAERHRRVALPEELAHVHLVLLEDFVELHVRLVLLLCFGARRRDHVHGAAQNERAAVYKIFADVRRQRAFCKSK